MIFLTLFVLATMLLAINIKPYASLGLVMIPVSYILGLYAYRNYIIWRSGPQGEERVGEELQKLSDDYVMVHNAVIPPSTGDIDYIVVGPSGIFVIETKNVGGNIFCDKDAWSRYKIGSGGKTFPLGIGNPSRQAKRSAKTLKDFILKHKEKIFGRRSPHLWVHSILVFTNKNVTLNLKNPTIDVLSVEELNKFILKQDGLHLPPEGVNGIVNVLVKNAF